MMIPSRFAGVIGAAAVALAAVPLSALVAPAISQAEGNCGYNFFWNSATNQCQFCDTPAMWWNYDTNTCLNVTPNVGPIAGPAGPVGVGPNPVAGPAGPVGVGIGPGPGGPGPR